MSPIDYANEIRQKFGNSTTTDGRTIGELDDIEIVKRMITRYPREREKVVGWEEFVGEKVPEAPKTEQDTEIESNYQNALQKFGGGVTRAFKQRGENVAEHKQATESGQQGLASGLLQSAGETAGFIGDVGFEAVKSVTPDFLKEPIKNALMGIGQSEPVQGVAEQYEAWKSENPELAENLEAVVNIASVIPGVGLGVKAGEKALDVAVQTAKQAPKVVENVVEGATETLAKIPKPNMTGTSESLIANVNRINPVKRKEFKAQQGISEEQWLRERGIIGTREETVKALTDNFSTLRKNVDEGLDRIPGQYRDSRVQVVADDAAEYAKNIESPDAGRMATLAEKAKGTGLTTKEINEVKRFYERNVKMGYLKDPTKTAEQVQKATNRDTGIRDALFEIADKNGFTNLRQLNKEIQANKFLADEIAGKMEGQGANNMMTLTDWIVATPGVVDPSFLAGFLGKKLLSTEGVKAWAARALSGFPKQKDLPRADLEEITRRAQEILKRQEAGKVQNQQSAILADELQKAGFVMGGGQKGFITEMPVPLTRQEQTLIKVANGRAEQQAIVRYILEQREAGNAVGEGFVIKNIDNTPLVNPQNPSPGTRGLQERPPVPEKETPESWNQ